MAVETIAGPRMFRRVTDTASSSPTRPPFQVFLQETPTAEHVWRYVGYTLRRREPFVATPVFGTAIELEIVSDPFHLRDFAWVRRHLAALRREYPGRWIAVERGRYVHAADRAELDAAIERAGFTEPYTFRVSRPDERDPEHTAYGG